MGNGNCNGLWVVGTGLEMDRHRCLAGVETALEERREKMGWGSSRVVVLAVGRWGSYNGGCEDDDDDDGNFD